MIIQEYKLHDNVLKYGEGQNMILQSAPLSVVAKGDGQLCVYAYNNPEWAGEFETEYQFQVIPTNKEFDRKQIENYTFLGTVTRKDPSLGFVDVTVHVFYRRYWPTLTQYETVVINASNQDSCQTAYCSESSEGGPTC